MRTIPKSAYPDKAIVVELVGMKQVFWKDLARVLEARGWVLLRVNGSHHIYGRSGNAIRLSLPIHANRSLKKELLLYLLKQAGLSEADI